MAAGNIKVVVPAAETKRPVIELRGVSKTYRTRDGEVPSLRPIDFTVGDGEFVVVVGPSGLRKDDVIGNDRRPAAAERRRNPG
jgi:NitT/TauT family transport system ATP-binding protein